MAHKTIATPVNLTNEEELKKYGNITLSPSERAAREAEVEEFKAAEALEAPLNARRSEYPPFGDQLDAAWKIIEALINNKPIPADAKAVLEQIKEIKARYPKN